MPDGTFISVFDHYGECFGGDRVVYVRNWCVSKKGGMSADEFKIGSKYFITYQP